MSYQRVNLENIHKLNTKEDPYHIHKTIGIICLANFIYQYYHFFFYYKTSMDNSHGLYLIGFHTSLSVSSLMFYIPSIRNKSAPMIYPEFRLHNIIFALRAVICFLLSYYDFHFVYKIGVCFITMIFADIASHVTREKDQTLIRSMPFEGEISQETVSGIKRFQGSMQVGATLYMLGNIHTAFFTLYGIQLPAFLMTLVRKNIIKPNSWHSLYSILLISNVFCYLSLPISYIIAEIVTYHLFVQLRFEQKMNKYYAWSIAFSIYSILYKILFICRIDMLYQPFSSYIQKGIILYFILTSQKYIL